MCNVSGEKNPAIYVQMLAKIKGMNYALGAKRDLELTQPFHHLLQCLPNALAQSIAAKLGFRSLV